MSEIYQIIVVATVAAFVILFLGKTGLREKIRNHFDEVGLKLVADMLDCDFCLSFWTCLALALFISIISCDIRWLVAIICSPPITRILL